MARSKTWPRFAQSLSEALAVLEEDQYLILERKSGWGYEQFAVQGQHGLRAEAMSNAYLSPDKQLSSAAAKRMTDLGWLAPTGSPEGSTPKEDPDGSPNYFIDWPRPVPFDTVAQLAVNTLVDVYEISHPGWMHYKAFARGGAQILLPSLGISREAPKASPRTNEPETIEAIRVRVLERVRAVTSDPKLEPDQDGDIPIRVGSSAVFVRIFGDPPTVRIWSPVLGDSESGSKLMVRINELNAQTMFVKWLVEGSVVVVTMDLFGQGLPTEHVLDACGIVGTASNEMDEQLQEDFGGRTYFGEMKPAPRGVGGYL